MLKYRDFSTAACGARRAGICGSSKNTSISMNSDSTNISAIDKAVEYPRYPKQCLTVEFHQSGAGGRYN